ncbi:hypothetical protein ASPVEDRAFT_155195 [Aspergillus versicolor CBS 583.65]|uniref:Rhodopsin domain-containing protein n=1 Tax=Aspergillus versicolor CBS 583.65 TaxID=1036611 RepID=A0A1L9Q0W6_ASPVE|nr:uncharacterized protein ASPVEDRAFT_155195 [Aspergillus versicolor CBS 583.65]OJJ07322.1 hypothetical protein ASPVEDRAFT_155195 [Aspergillus versicolor CBS 583.65]
MFETLQPSAYGVSFAFFALSLTTAILRMYSRNASSKALAETTGGCCLCLYALLLFPCRSKPLTFTQAFNTAQQGLFCVFLYHGGGLFVISPSSLRHMGDVLIKALNRHTTEVPMEHQAMLRKLLFAEEILYIWMHLIIKHAFLQFYLRLANKISFTYSVYATMALNVAVAVAIWLLYCLQCRPLPAFWNPTMYPDAVCRSHLLCARFNILTDFIILSLPIRPLWNMQPSLSRCLGVIAVVSVGSVAVIVSCLRLIVLHEFAVNPDFPYILGKMVIISAAELNVAIMAANAPSLKAVWLKHISGSLSNYMSSMPLSSLSKIQNAAPQAPVSRRRDTPKHDGDFADSSSMNNLVEPRSYDN